jgi:ubiquinone/menaquinone biosynthesis C-methylase UbiE
MAMEGAIARWYASSTGKNKDRQHETARALAARLAPGAHFLEIAPGPGYFCLALAGFGAFTITGLDISRSFVDIAKANALRAGLDIDFREGNASAMPFESSCFDAVFCQAAFKNFSEPVNAIAEMHRVLKPGGFAWIQDLRSDANRDGIGREVARMNLGALDRWFTRFTFDHLLLKSAYSIASMKAMIAQTPFQTGVFTLDDIGFDVLLHKTA